MWNFFRLENEHLNNCGQFRVVRDISIHPIDLSEVVDDDGEEHGVIKTIRRRASFLVGGNNTVQPIKNGILRKRSIVSLDSTAIPTDIGSPSETAVPAVTEVLPNAAVLSQDDLTVITEDGHTSIVHLETPM